METQPRTIARLIKQAQHYFKCHEWDEAAARCYQVLALEPNHPGAQRQLAQIYSQLDLVEDMRRTLNRLFPIPNASPHQVRRMLAFSYRVLSCWPGWQKDDVDETPPAYELEEVARIINHAYLIGEESELARAWNMYITECRKRPGCKLAIQWWMTKQYAEHGFFSDASEILHEILHPDPHNDDARYLLAEVRWWRDHPDAVVWVA